MNLNLINIVPGKFNWNFDQITLKVTKGHVLQKFD